MAHDPIGSGDRQPLDLQGDKGDKTENGKNFGNGKEEETDGGHIDFNLIVIISCCGFIVLVSLVVVIIIFRRRSQVPYNATPQDDLEIDIKNLPPNSAYHQASVAKHLNYRFSFSSFRKLDYANDRNLSFIYFLLCLCKSCDLMEKLKLNIY